MRAFMFEYATIGHRGDTAPTPSRSPWNDFCTMLSTPSTRSRKDGPAWMPVKFQEMNTRKAESITAITALVLDSDSGITGEQHRAFLSTVGACAFAHTTFNHSVDLQRWRIIMPLATATSPENLPALFDYVNSIYKGALDSCSKKPAQLYYLPAIPQGGSFECFLHEGPLLDPGPIIAARKNLQIGNIKDFIQEESLDFGNNDEFIDRQSGEVVHLRTWAVRTPDFMLASALRELAPTVIRGEERQGKQHIQCPFDSEHSDSTNDKATFCTDGSGEKNHGFAIFCFHDHCIGRDRLDYVARMLELRWLTVGSLTDNRYLADVRRPKKVFLEGDDLLHHKGFTALTPWERAHFLHFLFISWFIENGSFPDDPRWAVRQLGMAPEEWKNFREVLIHLDLAKACGGRLVSLIAEAPFRDACRIYNETVRAGREGGSKRKK